MTVGPSRSSSGSSDASHVRHDGSRGGGLHVPPPPVTYLFRTPRGRTAAASVSPSAPYDAFVRTLLEASARRDGFDGSCGGGEAAAAAEMPPRAAVSCDGAVVSTMMQRQSAACKNRRPCSAIGSASASAASSASASAAPAAAEDRRVRRRMAVPTESAFFVHDGRVLDRSSYRRLAVLASSPPASPSSSSREVHLTLHLRLLGGMTDRQNRVGSKFGGGGVSSAQQTERERKERLRELALESIDLARDPYLMRNHLGTYECKLCLTLHTNEANYLAHTQGKKHQAGLARRAAMEKKRAGDAVGPAPITTAGTASTAAQRSQPKVRIGRPGYEITKSRDPRTNQRCLTFYLHYPEIDDSRAVQPRHRFMSAYEQRVESPPDRRYQYLLVACDPYETVAFKVPNEPIDRGEGRFVTNWDAEGKRFTLTLYFVEPAAAAGGGGVTTAAE